MKCFNQDCKREARFCPSVIVPPHMECQDECCDDGAGTIGPGMDMIIGLPLCREHVESLDIADILTDDIREQVKAAFAHSAKMAPDFTRTQIQKVLLSDPRVSMLTQAFEDRIQVEGKC